MPSSDGKDYKALLAGYQAYANAYDTAIKAELKSLESSIGNWEKKVLEASAKDAEYQKLLATYRTPRQGER